MGHLARRAARTPDHPAVVMGASGTVRSFGDVDGGSNRLARHLRARGLGPGGHYAVFAENHPQFLEVCAAGERAGLRVTPINSHLLAEEVAYILRDSGAQALVTTPACLDVAAAAVAGAPGVRDALVLDPDGGRSPAQLPPGFRRYEEALAGLPGTPVADEALGQVMFYSSGTTGRPKGVKRAMPDLPSDADLPYEAMFRHLYGCREDDVYLSPAPLYHTAPLAFSLVMLRLGATVVVMERFDAEAALELIERHRVTFAQLVPTMFVRMLKLPEEVRGRYDLSSLRVAVHAAEPCPVAVKERMIEWWGPIVCEYYGGTEGNGITFIDARDWLAHKGSVGRPLLGQVHIVDDDGNDLGPGQVGRVYFSGGPDFEYHNDPEKTAAAGVGSGRSTIGDLGYVDADGYLYLSDRRDHLIISGGVNIYPREVEQALILHPAVYDVAVIGLPDEDMGERVLAVVQPAPGVEPGPALESALLDHCRAQLARFKCPRAVEFVDALPRLDTGKLYKRELLDRFRPATAPRGD